jgi:phosphohistidine swiveling domain-containing protein
MDIEWAKDVRSGELFLVQARPETVLTRRDPLVLERCHLERRGEVGGEGPQRRQKIGAGPARIIRSAADLEQLQHGDVLVTDMTDPDWEPVMKRAAAVVTDRGGRTRHAAIVSRELGIPAIVGTPGWSPFSWTTGWRPVPACVSRWTLFVTWDRRAWSSRSGWLGGGLPRTRGGGGRGSARVSRAGLSRSEGGIAIFLRRRTPRSPQCCTQPSSECGNADATRGSARFSLESLTPASLWHSSRPGPEALDWDCGRLRTAVPMACTVLLITLAGQLRQARARGGCDGGYQEHPGRD